MEFPFGQTVYRLRAGVLTDPYSQEPIGADWDNTTALEIPGAFVAHTSTSMLATATREQALESKSLFCDDSFDVQKGDRIFIGVFSPGRAPSEDLAPSPALIPSETALIGVQYSIDGVPPASDMNPWTGWTPPREIPLTRYVG